ncbi:hypothetical protein ACIPRI_16025 [Variovorax sp. LARHSF232]
MKRAGIARHLIAAVLALAFNAQAQDGMSYPERLAQFASQLERARTSQLEFTRVAQCLRQHEVNLEQRSKDLQLQLGPLLTQENDLNAQVQSLAVASQAHGRDLAAAATSVAEHEKKIASMPNRKRYEQYEKLCNVSYVAPFDRRWCAFNDKYKVSTLATAKADLEAARRRRDIAQGTLDKAKADHDTADASLVRTRAQLAFTRSNVVETTGKIVSTKKSILEVTLLDQPLLVSIDQFASELAAAAQVDLADERPRTLRKLDDISRGIDGTTQSGRAASSRVDQALGAGWVTTCLSN